MRLRNYQKSGLRFLVRESKACLYWEMRLGKTITSVKAIRVLRAYPCLIVAPYSAFPSWFEAIGGQGCLTVLEGPQGPRLALLRGKNTLFYLINSEGHRILPELADYEWASIILDESTFIKNPRSKASKFYTSKFTDVPVKFVLSGTPDPESRLDFIQQLRFLDRIGNYWSFRDRFCYLEGYKYILKPSGRKFLTKILSECAAFLKQKDVNLGGEKIYQTHFVKLPPPAMKQYKQIIKNLKISHNRMTIYKTVAFMWARRLFGGFVGKKIIHQEKMKLIKNIFHNSRPLTRGKIILAPFKQEIYFITSQLKAFGDVGQITGDTKPKDRFELVRKFQSGNLKILVCQPDTVRHGLNLSRAGEIIFYSSPLSFETRYQCEARASLNEDGVFITDIVCGGTIEEDIVVSMRKKENQSELFNRMIRRINGAIN